MATFQDKLKISLGSAALFAAVNMAGTYRLTSKLLPFDTYNPIQNCPTMVGQLIHATVFFLISFLTMGDPRVNTNEKIKNALYGTLIFFVLSSPAMYSVTGALFGPGIANPDGCPTLMGVLLHAAVYCASLVGVMHL